MPRKLVEGERKSYKLRDDPVFAYRLSCLTIERVIRNKNRASSGNGEPTKRELPFWVVRPLIMGLIHLLGETNVAHFDDWAYIRVQSLECGSGRYNGHLWAACLEDRSEKNDELAHCVPRPIQYMISPFSLF